MKNKTMSSPANFFAAYRQVCAKGRMPGVIYLLFFFTLLTGTATRAPAGGQHTESQAENIVIEQASQPQMMHAASADSFQLEDYSINAAGTIDDSSANYRLGFSLGQSVAGTASSASYRMVIGFWGGPNLFTCGDANGDKIINVGDAVYLIGYIFRGGPAPNPLAAGDANCDGPINVGDAVYLISYIFRGGPAPCCP